MRLTASEIATRIGEFSSVANERTYDFETLLFVTELNAQFAPTLAHMLILRAITTDKVTVSAFDEQVDEKPFATA